MKIDIITYCRTKNYGGILQAYGLYKYLENQRYDVQLIDYIPTRCNVEDKKAFVNYTTKMSRVWGKNAITKWLFSVYRYPRIRKMYTPFYSFMDERVSFTKRYANIEELVKDPPRADVYITGSDQVWNSQFTYGELDLPFYLSFIKNEKKIAYASSFGRDYIPEEHKTIVKELIGRYDSVSVREDSGRKILSELDIDAQVVVDPTLLCSRSIWESITGPQICNNYFLLYLINYDEAIYLATLKFAKKYRKRLIVISLDKKTGFHKKNLVVTPQIEDWMSYIKYADGIITDSFHACVFSTVFNKPFIVNSATRKGMSGRILGFLNSLDLADRTCNSTEVRMLEKTMMQPINWSECNHTLSLLQSYSANWIVEAING